MTGEFGGDVQISGLGAGGDATAVAIIGDLQTLARDRAAIVPAPSLSTPRHVVGVRRMDERGAALDGSPERLGGFNGVVVGRDLAAEVL